MKAGQERIAKVISMYYGLPLHEVTAIIQLVNPKMEK